MLNVDISKVFPAKAFNYVIALIPGLFFEISILLGNPELIRGVIARAQSAYAFSYYSLLAIALILGFIVGEGFMLLVMVIQRLLGYVYRFKVLLWRQVARWPIVPFLSWLLQKPKWNQRRWLGRLFRYVQVESFPFSEELREVQRCWHLVASELLERRYGIKRRAGASTDWGVWYSVLGTPTAEDIRGNILMIACHATGWCGITAIHFAPVLKNTYYIGFLSLLIWCGISHDWYVAKRLRDPVWAGLVRVRTVLAELRQTAPIKEPAPREAENNMG